MTGDIVKREKKNPLHTFFISVHVKEGRGAHVQNEDSIKNNF